MLTNPLLSQTPNQASQDSLTLTPGEGVGGSSASTPETPVTVSLDIVWQGSTGKQDARMSEISMEGCYIDNQSQGRAMGDVVAFKVHLPSGPWVALEGVLVNDDYPMGFGLRFHGLSDGDKRLLREVVIAHGGNPVWVDPLPRNNSVVLEADDYRAVVGEAAGPSSGQSQVPADRGRILVADDDALTLRMVAAIVETEGYEVVAVADGREALRVLQQDHDIHSAIFDMAMPHVPGLDLLLFMKGDERLRTIPVGMITGQTDPKVWEDSVAAGACVFLPKPFTPPQVAMMLRILATQAA
jgi:two-component system, chemotaxis family, chemotaxis protein CheY